MKGKIKKQKNDVKGQKNQQQINKNLKNQTWSE